MGNTTEALRAILKPRAAEVAKPKVTLDAATDEGAEISGADSYTITDITLRAVAAVQQWAETDDLDDGESKADRLLALIVGIADANKDGEITEDEQGVLDVALNAAWDYLAKLGVSEEDAGALLNDWDADTADRVCELIVSVLPDGEEADADLDDFVFGDNDQEPALDAVYKVKTAFRGGKKVRIKKRVSGTVRLSAKQKVAIRKMHMKSHSAGAQMRRMKSMRMRRKSGL